MAEVDSGKWALARLAGAAEVIDPQVDGALRKGGKLVCVGLMGGAATVQPVMMALRAVTVQGSYVGSLQQLRELLALANDATHPPLPDLPVTERPLAQADAVLDDLRAGRIRGRVVLTS